MLDTAIQQQTKKVEERKHCKRREFPCGKCSINLYNQNENVRCAMIQFRFAFIYPRVGPAAISESCNRHEPCYAISWKWHANLWLKRVKHEDITDKERITTNNNITRKKKQRTIREIKLKLRLFRKSRTFSLNNYNMTPLIKFYVLFCNRKTQTD